MSLVTLLPFIVLIGAMFLMTRSAKKKQQQAVQMRDQMQPGSGVRTIGGMYATVKEVSEDTVLVEAAPGVHLIFAKNAIAVVLEDDEYNRLVHGTDETDETDGSDDLDGAVVPDDASSLTEAAESEDSRASRIDLGKKDADTEAAGDAVDGAEKAADAEPKKTDGESDAK
ncbi:preprotein translocase subunit YajC [Streptomyces sp. NPDC059578]|uniref:preprotein translocase subunit YajC n=1 Tax=unclassified Streptomyces TaxID=2593676 RepID=UPI00366408A2